MSAEKTESPFKIPIFRSVWIANIFSNLGAMIQTVGAAWTMVSLNASPQMIAAVQTAAAAPYIFLSLHAGAIADIVDRRKMIIASQSFMFLTSIILVAYAWFGLLTPWGLLIFTFLVGCGNALKQTAWEPSVGDMVPRASLSSAVALNILGFNIARSVGPALGGMVVATLGAVVSFLINALSGLGLLFVIILWKRKVEPSHWPRERLNVAVAAGLRYSALTPSLRIILIRGTVFSIGASASAALMPLVARDLVAGGPFVYGLLLGAFGVGAIAGAIPGTWLRARTTTEYTIQFATLALAAGTILASQSRLLPLTMVALAISGVGWVIAMSTFNVVMQLSAPRWAMARVLSVLQMLVFGAIAFGSWGFGAIAQAYGVSGSLLSSAACLAVSSMAALRLKLPKMGDNALDPPDRSMEHPTVMPIDPNSGPIVVTTEYRIAEDSTVTFLRAMDERRRIRRRDGATRWSLLRDLNDTQLWIEYYHIATWSEYVLHSLRRTEGDAKNFTEVLLMHQDDKPPVARWMVERRASARSRKGIAGRPKSGIVVRPIL